jgi:hypothetical protein
MEADCSFYDEAICTLQEAVELSVGRQVSSSIQSDAVYFLYQLMTAEQRDKFRFSDWYVGNLHNQVFGGSEDDPISVSSDGGDFDDMPVLVYPCKCGKGESHFPSVCN